MTKKDTIIVAVLFNIVVLAGVLATARQLSLSTPPVAKESHGIERGLEDVDLSDRASVQEESPIAFDEIDQLLEEYIAEGPTIAPPKESDLPVERKTNQHTKVAKDSDEMFYIVKAGDNPWKIAKKFHLPFEKLLQLNHLDEAKARNLKVGQKLRIRE
jgi:LysM repeat protein